MKFLTHDNYKRPFLVVYFPHKHLVEIHASSNYHIQKIRYDRLLFKFSNVQRVFIGKDRDPMNTHLPATFRDGNSMLLKLPENVYIFVGTQIYSFRPPLDDSITSFHSNIGNNDFPEPIAVGKKNFYYLFDRKYVIKKNGQSWKDALKKNYELKTLNKKMKINRMFMKHLQVYGWDRAQSSGGVSFVPFKSSYN